MKWHERTINKKEQVIRGSDKLTRRRSEEEIEMYFRKRDLQVKFVSELIVKVGSSRIKRLLSKCRALPTGVTDRLTQLFRNGAAKSYSQRD